MSESSPSFFSRIFLAWIAFFRTLFDPQFAAGVVELGRTALPSSEPRLGPHHEAQRESRPLDSQGRSPQAHSGEPARAPDDGPKPPEAAPQPVVLREATPDAACQLLAVLQREGRFVDFVMESLDAADDADVGAAARVVHDGCRKAIAEHIDIESIRSEQEGETITLEQGFDASRVRVTGRVTGEAPFTGTLSHKGWRVRRVTLPSMSKDHDATVLTPAEVEL
ncbi:MAG: DUF2760 domain-containing protein [Proteobacteria bacterium]|nr:DUF2760 domain-containing protein [Pseudomonadota bacterium]